MSNSTPSLLIPYIPELDSQSSDEIIRTLDEHGTRQTIECLNWKEQYPYRPLTSINIAHSGSYIYIDYLVRCNYLRAVNYENNSNVHQDSCVGSLVRMGPHNGTKLTDEQLDRVKRHPSCGTRPFEELEGMFSWNLLVAIPLDIMGVKFTGEPITMMANFYKCADLTSTPHFLSWAPIDTPEPDFHRPEFFAPITLEGK